MKLNLCTFFYKQTMKHAETLNTFRLRYWEPRQEREKKGIVIAATLLLLSVYFWIFWQPVNISIEQQKTEQQQLEQLQSRLDIHEKSMPLRKNITETEKDMPEYLSQLITGRAAKFDITLQNIQIQDGIIQIDLEPVDFNNLMKWLNQLREEEGLRVNQLAVIATTPGIVAVKQLELLYNQ